MTEHKKLSKGHKLQNCANLLRILKARRNAINKRNLIAFSKPPRKEFNPVQKEKAKNLIAAFVNKGSYGFAEIATSLYKNPKAGEKVLQHILDDLREAYISFRERAPQEIYDKMDASTRSVTLDSIKEKSVIPGKEKQDVSDRSGSGQQDSQEGPVGILDNQADVRGNGGRGGTIRGGTKGSGTKGDGQSSGDKGSNLDSSTPSGEQGDIELYPDGEGPIIEDAAAGDFDGQGSSLLGTEGDNELGDERPEEVGDYSDAVSETFREKQLKSKSAAEES